MSAISGCTDAMAPLVVDGGKKGKKVQYIVHAGHNITILDYSTRINMNARVKYEYFIGRVRFITYVVKRQHRCHSHNAIVFHNGYTVT